MKIKVIITGSTGMVGKGVLLECIESELVESILVINRRPLEITHEKIKEILVEEFGEIDSHRSALKGYDACYFCLGTSAAGMSEEDYRKITYDLTINFAFLVLDLNPDLTFCYVSGAGTDSAEKSRMMWARVKGKTENKLLEMPFKDVYMFRPGFIQPMKGIRSRTSIYNAIYFIFRPLFPLFKLFPAYTTTTVKLGQAMIHVGTKGWEKKVLESIDINKIAEKAIQQD